MTDSGQTKADELFDSLIEAARNAGCSDVHISADKLPAFRMEGHIVHSLPDQPGLSPEPVSRSILQTMIEGLAGLQGIKQLEDRGSLDGATAVGNSDSPIRIRFNIFRAQNSQSIAIRILDDQFRNLEQLGLPKRLYELCENKDGLVLVAGPTGSGKSTTLATMIDRINQTRPAHIITIEDPIEFVHRDARSIVTQRQVGLDTPDFGQALIDALRQDPDVVLVGELRELSTIRTAIEAAETGHLVFATVHAGDAVGAIERLVSVFPGDERPLIGQMLGTSFRGVIVQHLLPGLQSLDSGETPGRVLASEILLGNSAVANLISNGNLTQLRSIMETSSAEGMQTLDTGLAKLCRERKIDRPVALALARNPKMLTQLARAV